MVAGQKVVGYVRVSTAEQADSGAGLEAQRAAIRAECARRGWELVEILEDAGASGKSLRGRPGLQRAIDQVEFGECEAIIVSKLDRLSRSLLDFAGIVARAQKWGWNLVALDLGVDLSTPSGKFIANVMASAAEWERELISQRTKDGLAVKRAQGVRLGRRPSIDPETEGRIRAMRERGMTMRAIIAQLNSEGTPTAQGGRWHPSTLQRVLGRQSPAAN